MATKKKAAKKKAEEARSAQQASASAKRPTPERKAESSSDRRKSSDAFRRGTGQVSEEPTPVAQSGSCNSPSMSEAIPTMGLLLIPAGLMLRRRRIGKIRGKE